MISRNIKYKLSFVLVLLMTVFFNGCGGGAGDISTAPDEVEAAESEGPSVDEPETQEAATSPDTSDIWAPAMEPALEVGLPSKNDVPYPPYPGAIVYSHGYVGEGQANVVIWSISTDPPEDVFSFYQEQMKGWRFEESQQEGFSYLLWEGGAEDVVDAYAHLIPAILIREPYEIELEYMDEWLPGIQTEFTVIYPAN